MSELVHQIGELFLRAVPVALIVLIFYFVMRFLFFKPLLNVMAEREARTIGAKKAAELAQAAAAEKIKQYEEALKQARVKVYAEQEAQRKKILDERAAALKQVRAKLAAEVAVAKDGIAAETAAAKKELEAGITPIASEIAQRVLQASSSPGGSSPGGPSREVR
jgi:F-type H+-transporting ATPase subunit b